MTPEALQQLILSDQQAAAMAIADQWKECADRCTEIAIPLRVPIPAQVLSRASALDGSFGKITLAAREGAEAPDSVKGVCVTFLFWMSQGWDLDIDLPQVQVMMGVLISAGIITQEQANDISALANRQPTITALECRIAIRGA